jgi:hypothetical protein
MRRTTLKGAALLGVCRRYATGAKPTKKRAVKGESTSVSTKANEKSEKKKQKTTTKNSPTTRKLGDKKTTLEIGTAFEMRSLKLLRDNFSMALERVAGRGDGGIDLIGWWWLPRIAGLPSSSEPTADNASDHSRIRVLAQCKAEKGKMGPNYVRELEGVLHRVLHSPSTVVFGIEDQPSIEAASEPRNSEESPTYPRLTPTLAMLISQSPFTNAAVLRAMSSPIPFILLHLPPEPDPLKENDAHEVASPSLQWNPVLGSEKGLLGGNLEVRWERRGPGGHPTLWWKGRPMRTFIPN